MFHNINEYLVIIFILCTIIGIIKGFIELFISAYKKMRYKRLPIVAKSAKIITKRERILPCGRSTYYYIAMEFPNKEREEYSVAGRTYGLLLEGDIGTAHIKGEKLIEFDRVKNKFRLY